MIDLQETAWSGFPRCAACSREREQAVEQPVSSDYRNLPQTRMKAGHQVLRFGLQPTNPS
jgi:hypothetical protein